MAVIGFVTYEDFCNEVHDAGVIRLQDYYRRINGSIGLPEIRSYIELAAVDGENVYVCRFSLGGGWDVDSERAQRDREQENVERALNILRHDLEQRGLTVRPGLIATAQDSHVSTTCKLWRWERDEQGLPVLVGVDGINDGN